MIPLLAITPQASSGEELSFLANEVFSYPPDLRLLVNALTRYSREKEIPTTTLSKTETRDRWIEVRSHSSYLFEYKGIISDERIKSLRDRISELLAVGRNSFTVNLTAALHLDNLSPNTFVSLWQMTIRSAAEIRFVLPVSSLASSLISLGIPVDEYLPDGLHGMQSYREETKKPETL
jgi:hypothetical protein